MQRQSGTFRQHNSEPRGFMHRAERTCSVASVDARIVLRNVHQNQIIVASICRRLFQCKHQQRQLHNTQKKSKW